MTTSVVSIKNFCFQPSTLRNKLDPLETLPLDIVNVIFSKCSGFDLVRCERVCKSWCRVVKGSLAWEVCKETLFPQNEPLIYQPRVEKTARENVVLRLSQPSLIKYTALIHNEKHSLLKERLLSLPIVDWNHDCMKEWNEIKKGKFKSIKACKQLKALFDFTSPVIILNQWQFKENGAVERLTEGGKEFIVVIPRVSPTHESRVCIQFVPEQESLTRRSTRYACQITLYKEKDSGKVYLSRSRGENKENQAPAKQVPFIQFMEQELKGTGLLN